MTTRTVEHPRVVSKEEWIAARKELLKEERTFTHQRDVLSARRREMPWEKVEKEYIFDTPAGKKSLGELFAGRSQLIVYHFMFGPDWTEGCPSCSFIADTFDGVTIHLAHRDTTLTAISRASMEQIEAFKKRMGWRFPWASSNGNEFNFDFGVSFRKEDRKDGKVRYNYEETDFPSDEAPGASVFYKDASGAIYHTYSTFARGLDILLTAYNYLDMVPKGRDEDPAIQYKMSWVRHHDKYGDGYKIDPKGEYVAPIAAAATAKGGCCEHHS